MHLSIGQIGVPFKMNLVFTLVEVYLTYYQAPSLSDLTNYISSSLVK